MWREKHLKKEVRPTMIPTRLPNRATSEVSRCACSSEGMGSTIPIKIASMQIAGGDLSYMAYLASQSSQGSPTFVAASYPHDSDR